MKSEYIATKRFQHTMVFVNKYMIILGGRGNELVSIPIEVYDTEIGEWFYLFNFNKFRQVSWAIDRYVFIQGGCDYERPFEPIDKIIMFDFMDLTSMLRK
jgi:hypothetical protein